MPILDWITGDETALHQLLQLETKDQVAETPKTPGATTDKAAAAKDNKPLRLPQAHRR